MQSSFCQERRQTHLIQRSASDRLSRISKINAEYLQASKEKCDTYSSSDESGKDIVNFHATLAASSNNFAYDISNFLHIASPQRWQWRQKMRLPEAATMLARDAIWGMVIRSVLMKVDCLLLDD